MKKILVTGGAGYIGSHLIRQLLEKNYEVVVLDNFIYGRKGMESIKSNAHLRIVEGDIRHIEDVVSAMKGAYGVIDLAAFVGDPVCKIDEDTTLTINYEATKAVCGIVEYLKVKRFIFASTCSIYGYGREVFTEESAPNPLSLYAESKLKSEEVILKDTSGVSSTILRLATVYGVSQRMRYDLVLNILSARAVKEKEITICGGAQWRPIVHVSDVARAFIRVLESDEDKIAGQIFNVGSEEQNYQVKQLGEMVEEFIPNTELTIKDNDEDERSYRVSFEKIKRVLDFDIKTTPRQGIREIKSLLEKTEIGDYRDDIYYNVKYAFKE